MDSVYRTIQLESEKRSHLPSPEKLQRKSHYFISSTDFNNIPFVLLTLSFCLELRGDPKTPTGNIS